MLLQLSEGIKNNKKWHLARATSLLNPPLSGFPTGVEDIGEGSSKFDGGAQLKSTHGGSIGGEGGRLKMLSKIPVKEFI